MRVRDVLLHGREPPVLPGLGIPPRAGPAKERCGGRLVGSWDRASRHIVRSAVAGHSGKGHHSMSAVSRRSFFLEELARGLGDNGHRRAHVRDINPISEVDGLGSAQHVGEALFHAS